VCEAEIEKPNSNTSIQTAILAELQKGQFSSRELAVKVACDEASLIFALKNLLENKRIFLDHTNRYSLSK
jgi:predicted transcriptional regulator